MSGPYIAVYRSWRRDRAWSIERRNQQVAVDMSERMAKRIARLLNEDDDQARRREFTVEDTMRGGEQIEASYQAWLTRQECP